MIINNECVCVIRNRILHDKGDGTEVKRREPSSSNFSFFKKISEDSKCEMSLSETDKKKGERERANVWSPRIRWPQTQLPLQSQVFYHEHLDADKSKMEPWIQILSSGSKSIHTKHDMLLDSFAMVTPNLIWGRSKSVALLFTSYCPDHLK